MKPHGPFFHRWLPDGEKDALKINTGNPSIELKLWFERKGYVGAVGFIEYDDERQDVDESVMGRQATLDAGPIFGKLTFNKISEADAEILNQNKINDPGYIELGKIIYNLLYPILSRFITILRINYGQYWIKELDPWDSRTYPLGHYCQTFLQMQWSLDNEHTWKDFRPSDGNIIIHARKLSDNYFQQYLLPEDYRNLENIINDHYSPSLAARGVGLAHEIFHQGNLKHALVEAVTALELALQEFHRIKSKTDEEISKHMEAFWNLPLKVQLLATANSLPDYNPETMKQAIKAIDMRNKIVHEGWSPVYTNETRKTIKELLELISLFIEGPVFKFPAAPRGGTRLYPPV